MENRNLNIFDCFRLFEWRNKNCTFNMFFNMFRQMYDPLVGTATEMEFRITERFDERTVDQCIDIWQDLLHALVLKDLLIGESCIAPDILAGFLLDTTGQLGKCLNLIQGISA